MLYMQGYRVEDPSGRLVQLFNLDDFTQDIYAGVLYAAYGMSSEASSFRAH
jgi:hypothetical protein